jgi:tetratricopeptide (TPR) repeat protein
MTGRRIVLNGTNKRPRMAAIVFAAVAAGWGCAHAPRLVVLHDPLSPEEHLALGVAYEREGNRALARGEYEAVLRRRPDHVPAMVNLGNLAAAEGSRRDAEAWYHRALRVGGQDAAPAANNLAWLYLEQRKRLRVATSLARKAVAWDPRPAYVDTLARVLIARNKPQEAAEVLREAEAGAERATALREAAAP